MHRTGEQQQHERRVPLMKVARLVTPFQVSSAPVPVAGVLKIETAINRHRPLSSADADNTMAPAMSTVPAIICSPSERSASSAEDARGDHGERDA
jgi:hypothetical protein